MRKHAILAILLVAYIAILIKVMVFKDVPLIRIGSLMLNFGGINAGHAPNFVPLRTILPYLFGYKGWIIAGINLVGNIILLVPLGFIAPFVYRNMPWRRSLVLAIASGLVIEVMQALLRVGIFDIDDVILNAFGFMVGYWASLVLSKWAHERNFKNIFIAAAISIAAAAAFYGIVVYPLSHLPVNPGVDAVGSEIPKGADLCGGTGGNGRIVSLGNNRVTIKKNEGGNQVIHLADQAKIETSSGSATTSDLKIGDRITLVGGPNSDGSFTADTLVVCSVR